MNEFTLDSLAEETSDERGSQFVASVLKAAMSLPGARVHQASFLRDQLSSHCRGEQVTYAIRHNPADAGIPLKRIHKIADSVIKSHVVKAAGGSFAASIPGGLAIALTIPADLVQFVWHAIVLAQELAYLYGWPDLTREGNPDAETEFRMLLLMGCMLGVGEANHVMAEVAKHFAQHVGHELPKQTLTKAFFWPALRQILKALGIKLTKKSFAQTLANIIPVISGAIGAMFTTIALRSMARKLRKHLRGLEFTRPSSNSISLATTH